MTIFSNFLTKQLLFAALPMTLLLGCGGDEGPQEVAAAIRPVKTIVVGGGDSGSLRTFPARIEAARHAELGFRVSGSVQDILVKESENVAEGAVLARLDPTDFEIVVKDRQAAFDNAQRNFSRAKDLVEDGNISRMDYDRMVASFESAEAGLDQANQNLAYTQLKAPFDGRIARRYVERFEEVSAKQTVFNLQQIDTFDVKIDLPESLVRSLALNTDDLDTSRNADRVSAWAEFEGVADERFDLRIKEAATTADPKTQTFEVTLSMENPKTFVVLPGMTAQVTVDLSRVAALTEVQWVPTSAVVADAGLAAHVWVLDSDSMKVEKREVAIGSMQGSQIEVTGGLFAGDEVVAVGTSYLAEGMQVSRMAKTEQAVPRSGESG